MVAKKKKAKRITNIGSRNTFSFDGWEDMSGAEFHKLKQDAYTFFRDTLSPADTSKLVKDWAKQNKMKIDSEANISPILGALCKLIAIGCPAYNEKENEHWQSLPGTTGSVRSIDDDIRVRVEKICTKKRPKTIEKPKTVISVRDRMLEQLDPLLSNIEGVFDDWLDKKIKFKDIDFYKMFISYEHQIKAAHTKIILDRFEKMIAESKDVLEFKDEEIKEAYGHLTAARRKEMFKLYESIETACEMISRKSKATRKPRKPKQISKEKLVAKVQYQKVNTTYNIASLNPVDILDSKEVWVFNTKTRKIGQYLADEYEGPLSIKGTTIIGFDKIKSAAKTLRKPEEQLKEFSKSGKVQLRKFMDNINSKETVLTGRLNKDTVILKIAR